MNKYKVYRHGEKEPFIVIGVYPTMERGKLVLFDNTPGFDENGNPTRVISAAIPDVEWFYMVGSGDADNNEHQFTVPKTSVLALGKSALRVGDTVKITDTVTIQEICGDCFKVTKSASVDGSVG